MLGANSVTWAYLCPSPDRDLGRGRGVRCSGTICRHKLLRIWIVGSW